MTENFIKLMPGTKQHMQETQRTPSRINAKKPQPTNQLNKQKKLQANITDEHTLKNPQQNFSKQNSATYQKAHTL